MMNIEEHCKDKDLEYKYISRKDINNLIREGMTDHHVFLIGRELKVYHHLHGIVLIPNEEGSE